MQDSKAGAVAAVTELRRLLHQFNQPLTAIGNYAQAGNSLIASGQTDSHQLQELFGKIAAQSARATALSQELGKAVSTLIPEEQ